jgi:hypothetical protein
VNIFGCGPQREQLEWRQVDLEGLIAEDHVARVL